jgi:GT2 family glycosyltransferase
MIAPSTPDVSVVVVSYNTSDLLRNCLQTLKREAGDITYETLVVDNASRDGSADMVEQEFPALMRQAWQETQGGLISPTRPW